MSVKEDGSHTSVNAQNAGTQNASVQNAGTQNANAQNANAQNANAQSALYQNIKRFMQVGGNTNKAEPIDKVLGMVLLRDKESKVTYAFRAQYATGSTKNEPVVAVLSNFQDGHKTYEIQVSQIKPQKASMMEMFCLCCYVSDIQQDGQLAVDLFQDLKSMMELRDSLAGQTTKNRVRTKAAGEETKRKEYEKKVQNTKEQKIKESQDKETKNNSFEEKLLEKQNWEKKINELKDIFLEAGEYHSYQCCLRLMDLFDFCYTWTNAEHTDEQTEDMDEEVVQTLQKWEETAKSCKTVTDAVRELIRQDKKLNLENLF